MNTRPEPVNAFALAAKLEQLLCVLINSVAGVNLTQADVIHLRRGDELLQSLHDQRFGSIGSRSRRAFSMLAAVPSLDPVALESKREDTESASRTIRALADALENDATPPSVGELESAREVVGRVFTAVVGTLAA